MVVKFLLILISAGLLQGADPLLSRVWTSTAGTTLEAQALSIKDGMVQFKTADGREIPVALNQLVPADQKLLAEAFPEKPLEVPAAAAPSDLPFPQGEVVGPVNSGEKSNYLLYLPKILATDTPAPVMFYGGSGGCTPAKLEPMVRAAELTGMILAGSVENRNGMTNPATYENTLASYNHMKTSLPMDPIRMSFIGGSGGGARTFYQASLFKDVCVGAIPFIGYMPDGNLRWDRQTFFYIMGGGADYKDRKQRRIKSLQVSSVPGLTSRQNVNLHTATAVKRTGCWPGGTNGFAEL